ncbi:bifunctional [glutamate--ammonia ligase]-adenylyl-L-tyrosine phosphorylase/[glutamate--ammonia-ligase] adenylyltransferase [Psychrobacter piechaudii]|uniref:Bifunctional glutamine synthetase adenylyltransferase/adenylyl-removing enzyme n=1 Tax=Psychrobacter piechaudii TaxID=1945521 RepID=A0A1R4GWU9_9GAMM|nr:bifunctional [glutamate--ammonia ligase]-adenylyl-L-tyrosine phosphorylase/[glutamate--ammonia-ligase] adenylyltransferase [Psychrobacter piechaudii]SJM72594.1 Glutamate-ammonia-ligase adenylyltransferase [Psychrobacter piechaudii]
MPSEHSFNNPLTQDHSSLTANQITAEHIQKLKLASPFAYQVWKSKPTICQNFLTSYPLEEVLTRQQICDLIDDYTLDDGLEGELERADEAGVMKGLRRLRELLMLRWIWQDALGVIPLEQLTGELSSFADNCLIFVKEYAWEQLVARYGRPTYIDEKGQLQYDDMAIFAMGKLGAQELNLSSDIDLIFVHRARGETDGDKSKGTKCIDNKRFMIRLGQSIIKILDTCTAEGFVFRVDMRLRPWGEGSDLAIHQPALEKYFSAHGRAWERFAWLKARIINEVDQDFADDLEDIVRPFVFRYYVDYSAFAALREMKSLIQNQVAQREDLDNIKLGAGGIRDIEFVVQAFQLIYGGRHPQLEVKSCLKAMQVLNEFDFIDDKTYEQLEEAYRFLRRVEHGIQAIHDQQTQRLPNSAEYQNNLAVTLGFEDWQSFLQRLDEHRQNVNVPFDRMVTERQIPKDVTVTSDTEVESLDSVLNEENKAKLEQFWNSKMVANLSEEARGRLDDAYPVLVHALLEHEKTQGLANVAFPRLLDLIEAICRRSIYLVMLAENPNATVNLIPMLSASPWIAGELTRYPVLLDSFLQQRYRHLPDKEELADILRQSLLRVEPDDEEMLLNVLRLFKNTQVLAVAASDVLAERPIMKVSDSLTDIAEVVLEFTLERAFSELVKRHGYPINQQGESVNETNNGFAIIGYGKLGGIEMSYTSDLDLVFIHQINEQAMTTGAKPVSGMKFTARLAQKLMTYLNTQTRDGRAYEIDMRLRPSGNAGMMVVSSRSFERYQLEKAWVWEHQALVRARAICGDKRVMSAFNHTRKQVLARKRDIEDLKQNVIEMRSKMKDHLGSNQQAQQEGKFHLKQDAGGIVDIEFMAQYAVLAHAHDHPELTKWSDNVRIFESLAEAGVWEAETCEGLTRAYLLLRAAMHQIALANEPIVVESSHWDQTREYVISKWNEIVV